MEHWNVSCRLSGCSGAWFGILEFTGEGFEVSGVVDI